MTNAAINSQRLDGAPFERPSLVRAHTPSCGSRSGANGGKLSTRNVPGGPPGLHISSVRGSVLVAGRIGAGESCLVSGLHGPVRRGRHPLRRDGNELRPDGVVAVASVRRLRQRRRRQRWLWGLCELAALRRGPLPRLPAPDAFAPAPRSAGPLPRPRAQPPSSPARAPARSRGSASPDYFGTSCPTTVVSTH